MVKSSRPFAKIQDHRSQRQVTLVGLVVLMVGGLMLSGCNTTAGAGQDVKATGSAITRGADDVKSKL